LNSNGKRDRKDRGHVDKQAHRGLGVAFSSVEVVQILLTVLGVRVNHLLHHCGSFNPLDVCKNPKYFTNI
jgi:hypothetical protein